MSWLKQLTTSTFHSINAKVDRITFIKNNKKALAAMLVCWCLVVVGGYFFTRFAWNASIIRISE